MDTITLNKDEAEAIYELIKELAGSENVFAWDNLDHPQSSACAKIYRLAGQPIPDELIKLLDEQMVSRKLLSECARLINQHGPDSQEVQDFINLHRNNQKFVQLATLSQKLKRVLYLTNSYSVE